MFKIPKGVTLESFFIFSDRHAVAIFSQYHKASKTDVSWAEIFETAPVSFSVSAKARDGRIVLRNGLAVLVVTSAESIRVYSDGGSDKSKALGLDIQTLAVKMKNGDFSVTHIKDVMHAEFEYQDSSVGRETFASVAEETRWHDYRIAKVHRDGRLVGGPQPAASPSEEPAAVTS